MFSNKEFKENFEAVSSIKTITSLYQEIALLRMNQLKENVAKTREFLEGVAQVYNHAKAAYVNILKQQQSVGAKKDWRQLRFIKRNGKKILVFLSANEHLYGSLILDVWDQFKNDLKASKNDAVVVGSFGKYLVKNEEISSTVAFFELDDDKPKEEDIQKIVNFISQYEEIVVYYGKLVSILKQSPTKDQISGGVTLEADVKAKKYLFEPSPEKILEFFETEIIVALFNQTIYENQLARFAARMVAMDQATENAKEIQKKLEAEFITLKRRALNRKQLEVFAGLSLWSQDLEHQEAEDG